MRRELRELIDEAGGLHTQAGLAKRWGVKRATVHEAAQKEHFPQPATLIDGVRPVWFGGEADVWHETPRRPGPRPAN